MNCQSKKSDVTINQNWPLRLVNRSLILFCIHSDLVVLQQDEAEVELAEGQLQIFDIAMFKALLLWQVEDSATAVQTRGSTALSLRIQRRLQLILQCGESPLCFCKLLCVTKEWKHHQYVMQLERWNAYFWSNCECHVMSRALYK